MARTKQTARKSTGGKAPRKRLNRDGSPLPELSITDHTLNKVSLASRSWDGALGFFPFQVYILSTAERLATDDELARKLADYIHRNNAAIRFNENCRWHLQIYTLPQAGIIDCIEHHERGKLYRKSQGRGPEMLNRKELIIVDDYDWETKGLISVEYTAEMVGRHGSERKLESHVEEDYWLRMEDDEEKALPGTRRDLTVERYGDVNSLAEDFLQFVWYDEGHEWAMEPLIERNVAMGWPHDPGLLEANGLGNAPVAENITRGYLPTETKPRDPDEEEYEEEDEYVSVDHEDRDTFGESCDPETGIPVSIAYSSTRPMEVEHLPLPPFVLEGITVTEGTDSLGVPCTTCTRHDQASLNAQFSYSLYIIGEETHASSILFALLNRGFLEQIPWCLHVYNVLSIKEALLHSDAEITQRPSAKRYPLSYAGSLEQPLGYAAPVEQPFSNICLCIDGTAPLEAGPRIITSRSIADDVHLQLEVMHAGGWENASKMLFTYCILCSEMPRIMESLSPHPAPIITAAISLSSRCFCTNTFDDCPLPNGRHLILTLTLDPSAPHPMTANICQSILSSNRYTWDDFVSVIDPDSGEPLPLPDFSRFIRPGQCLDAERLQASSFNSSPTTETNYHLITLQPGEQVVRSVPLPDKRLCDKYNRCLIEGKTYRMELNSDIFVRRWVWGEIGAIKGPFGLEPIHVSTIGQGVDFTYDGPITDD